MPAVCISLYADWIVYYHTIHNKLTLETDINTSECNTYIAASNMHACFPICKLDRVFQIKY